MFVALIACLGLVLWPCIDLNYFVCFLVLESRERVALLLLLMSYKCYRSFTLPPGAMSSSVVCDYGIFGHARLLFDQ